MRDIIVSPQLSVYSDNFPAQDDKKNTHKNTFLLVSTILVSRDKPISS